MNKIIPPLKLQMNRAAMGDLHQALMLVGLDVTGAEKDSQRFGTPTREAVRRPPFVSRLTSRTPKSCSSKSFVGTR